MLRALAVTIFCLLSVNAAAIVGGARQVGLTGEPIVMIVGARGNSGVLCTGTALTRDLVLTSAHCVARGGDYRLLASRDSISMPIQTIIQHPQHDP